MKSLIPSRSKSPISAPVCSVEPPVGGSSPRLVERFCQTGSFPTSFCADARMVSSRIARAPMLAIVEVLKARNRLIRWLHHSWHREGLARHSPWIDTKYQPLNLPTRLFCHL